MAATGGYILLPAAQLEIADASISHGWVRGEAGKPRFVQNNAAAEWGNEGTA